MHSNAWIDTSKSASSTRSLVHTSQISPLPSKYLILNSTFVFCLFQFRLRKESVPVHAEVSLRHRAGAALHKQALEQDSLGGPVWLSALSGAPQDTDAPITTDTATRGASCHP